MSAEDFAGIREASRERRSRNRDKGQEHLKAAGIPFVVKNGGAHLIVAERWDAWPGTGLWSDRMTPTRGRGIRDLIKAVKAAGVVQ